MPSRTGYNDYKKAQYISKVLSDAYENELRRERDRAARQAFRNSPKGIAEQQKRDAIQEQTRAKEAELQNEMENLEAVLTVAISDLEANIKNDLATSSVKDVLKKYEKEIVDIDNKDERLSTLIRARYPGYKFSYLAKLFYKLSLLNPQFIVEAPAKTFIATQEKGNKQATYSLSSLTKDDLSKLHKRLIKEDKNISADDHFGCHYAKYFKEEIKNLKQLNAIKSCLVRYPEAFVNLDASVKFKLNAPNELSYVVSQSPSIIKYMTKAEIEEFANNSLKFIATAAMKEPEILDYLDEDFFTRHDYRICFVNYPKAKIIQKLGDKVQRHVRLQKFLHTKKENRSLDSSLNF